eukprot:1439814-Prymnesium_polylepis.1
MVRASFSGPVARELATGPGRSPTRRALSDFAGCEPRARRDAPAMHSYHDALERLRSGAIADGERALRRALPSLSATVLPDAHANLGTALSMLGRPAEASESFGASLRLRPADALTRYNLAALIGGARRDEAIAHYRHALALAPTVRHQNLWGPVPRLSLAVTRRAWLVRRFACDVCAAAAHHSRALADGDGRQQYRQPPRRIATDGRGGALLRRSAASQPAPRAVVQQPGESRKGRQHRRRPPRRPAVRPR